MAVSSSPLPCHLQIFIRQHSRILRQRLTPKWCLQFRMLWSRTLAQGVFLQSRARNLQAHLAEASSTCLRYSPSLYAVVRSTREEKRQVVTHHDPNRDGHLCFPDKDKTACPIWYQPHPLKFFESRKSVLCAGSRGWTKFRCRRTFHMPRGSLRQSNKHTV